ncbi:MAG: hypothetical protein B6I24_02390 [Bacteroidetes bacterium 4572_128]|nr:MAG: hypothetical protein B6I24_02390 [Bacteroidetes bacterium 4572_128]
MKSLKVLSSLVLIFCISMGGFSQKVKKKHVCDGDGDGYRDGHGYERGNIYKKIPDLTAEQEKKIESLVLTHKRKRIDFRNKRSSKEVHLRTLETSSTPNTKEINKTIEELSSIKTTMAKESSKHRMDVRALLTEKQKLYFDTHFEKKGKHDKRDHRGKKGHHKCDGRH